MYHVLISSPCIFVLIAFFCPITMTITSFIAHHYLRNRFYHCFHINDITIIIENIEIANINKTMAHGCSSSTLPMHTHESIVELKLQCFIFALHCTVCNVHTIFYLVQLRTRFIKEDQAFCCIRSQPFPAN